MMLRLLIAVLALTLLTGAQSIEKGWNRIVPFQTTRSQVERRLGTSEIDSSGYYTYRTKEAFVTVNYSGPPCGIVGYGRGDYRLREGTVLDYTVRFGSGIKIADVKYDPAHFRMETSDHILGIYYLFQDTAGIGLSIEFQQGSSYLTRAMFNGTKNKRAELKCSAKGPKKRT